MDNHQQGVFRIITQIKMHMSKSSCRQMKKICLLKTETHIDSKMVLFIRDNGKVLKDMDMESKYGQMELVMKENGGKIKLMEEENFGMSMVTYSMESGKMIKQMVMVYTLM